MLDIENENVKPKEIETRGKPIKCKYCSKEFKIINIEQKKQWKENNYHCPICAEEWCILPPTERTLKNLQTKYLKTRSDKILGEMYYIIKSYAQSLLKQKYSNMLRKKEDGVEYYSHEVSRIMIEKFLEDPEFKIESSFGGYMKGRRGQGGPLAQAIFGKEEHACAEDSIDFMYADGNSVEGTIKDDKKPVLQSIEETEDINLLHKKMIRLVNAIEPYCKSKEENFIRMNAVYLYLVGGEKAFDKYFKAFGKTGKYMSMKTLEILKNELIKGNEL